MPLSGACSGRLLGLDFTKISPQPRNCSTEASGGGTCAPLGKRDIASKVDSNGVAEKRCHVNWGHSRSVPDQSDRVSDAVQADYGDPSLPAEVLESVAVRVGLDGLSERGSQRLGEGRGAHIMSLTPPRAPGAGSVSGPLRSCPRP